MGIEVKIPYNVDGELTDCTIDIDTDELCTSTNADIAGFTTELFLQVKTAARKAEIENQRKRHLWEVQQAAQQEADEEPRRRPGNIGHERGSDGLPPKKYQTPSTLLELACGHQTVARRA